MRFLRYIWASPTTLIGLVVAFALLRRGHIAVVDGVVEAHGPLLERALVSFTPLAGPADAMTLGHVVLGRNALVLEMTRAHERVHVRQYDAGARSSARILLIHLYAAARGRHPYFRQPVRTGSPVAPMAFGTMKASMSTANCPTLRCGSRSLARTLDAFRQA